MVYDLMNGVLLWTCCITQWHGKGRSGINDHDLSWNEILARLALLPPESEARGIRNINLHVLKVVESESRLRCKWKHDFFLTLMLPRTSSATSPHPWLRELFVLLFQPASSLL